MPLSDELVLVHADEFVFAAQEFRRVATERMFRLAEHFGVSVLELSNHRFESDALPVPQVGNFDADWRYFFHGFQCSFGHHELKNGITVELGYGDDFGVLEPDFFADFLDNTPTFRHLHSVLPETHHGRAEILTLLEQQGHLIRVPGSSAFWCQQREPGLAAPFTSDR